MDENEIELKKAIEQAYGWTGDTYSMQLVGATEDKASGRIRKYYRDADGNYYYKNHYRHGDQIISEEEHIFGKKLNTRKIKHYSKANITAERKGEKENEEQNHI